MALQGADLLIYPTAIGWQDTDTVEEKQRQREAWITVQRGHAVANGIPVIAVNRVGHEDDPSGVSDGITFWGSSFVAGPQGEFLYQAPDDRGCDSRGGYRPPPLRECASLVAIPARPPHRPV